MEHVPQYAHNPVTLNPVEESSDMLILTYSEFKDKGYVLSHFHYIL